MSENIPSTSNSGSSPHHKRSRRKYDKAKLPTPPPDPNEAKTDDREDFLAYLDSLQKSNNLIYSRSTSAFAPAIATEDAFDHLEKLYKLMEQMLELREQNAKLHRRVRDLEHLNNLEKMHKQLDINSVQGECPELDKDTAFAETILESILSEAKNPKQKPSASSRLRQSISRRHRNRSGSVSLAAVSTEKSQNSDNDQIKSDRRASTCVDSRVNKPAKVSKWTKVKAAFKWEKASPTVSDAKSQDSGISGMVPVNLEVARYLRVPSTSDDHGHSPVDSGAAEISTPGTLSTASSAEDFHRNDLRSPCEDLRSSDDEHSHNYIPHSKDGSQKTSKCHKTPWAKMKDIIQTRNSFKKKHRLSTHSDDVQIDIELCSDNEEVFDEDDKNKTIQFSSPKICAQIYARADSNEVPPEIVARYQQAVAEDGTSLENADSKKVSKWTRVKKAFLPPHDINEIHISPSQLKESKPDDDKNIQEEIQRNYKQLQKKLSLEFQEKLSEWERMKQNSPGTSNPSSSCGFVDDSKDSAFIKKMEEWQKIKSQPSFKNRPNISMTSEEKLPPEFRKKLQEWEKIRKFSNKECPKKKLGEVPRWKSLSGARSDNSPVFEYPPLSEDFRKKLEEWKQIKSGVVTTSGGDDHEKKSKDFKSSPRLSRKDSSPRQGKKHKETHDKELQWFEKELGKIEKEKQRLERERQKFLEREESLSRLRSSVVGGLKKEVLIHTPSGFYRFEGISRKFTQKLYEWEKAQGIGPESSTFALLNSSLTQDSKPHPKHKSPENTPPLVRSKSADSIAISALNLTCPLMSHQPSSLSLNDVDDLEKECMADSKSSSMQYIGHSHETIALDEPEALIVEVEDIIEETAAPLHTYTQKTQQPVYQREEFKNMCEGETCAAPKVRRSESTRAQNNYNLIEEIFNILKNLTETELEIQKTQDNMVDQEKKANSDIIKLKMFDESQKAMVNTLCEKIIRLQEANSNVFSNMTREDSEFNVKHVIEVLEAVQDLSSEIYQLTEKLDFEITNRNVYDIFREVGARSLNPINEIAKEIRNKILELRRRLSYICAASDLTAPRRRQSSVKKKVINKTVSNESNESSRNNTDISRASSEKVAKEGRLYIKSDTSSTHSQGAIKKRIRYRQKSLQSRTLPDTDDEEENIEQKRNTHKKLTRTRSVSESSSNKNEYFCKDQDRENEIVVDESIIEKVVVPTHTNFVNITSVEDTTNKSSDSPVTVFVKTTRKLFTPFVESGLTFSSSEKVKDEIPSVKLDEAREVCTEEVAAISISENEHQIEEKNLEHQDNSSENSLILNSVTPVTHLPPLPASPIFQKKITKDISPGIRLMLAKYNQKISEQDSPSGKSAGSSGSASPVPWKSPSAERRVKAQTERYQEELNKLSPLLGGRREVQKSASVGFLHTSNKQVTVPRKTSVPYNISDNYNVLKSSSASALSVKQMEKEVEVEQSCTSYNTLTVNLTTDINSNLRHSPEIRLKKLQKAKEEFLRSSSVTPNSAPAQIINEPIKFPTRNRLSQISVDSESSYESTIAGALIKSASAGMINIEADAYKQFDPEVHGGGYVSLPRSTKKQKGLLSGKFAFSNIASKFRKVKMRKGKDKDNKMNTVSTLCRQSLIVDIQPLLNSEEQQRKESSASADPKLMFTDDASTSSKTGSWIRRSKLFKK